MYCQNRNIHAQTCAVLWCFNYVTAISEIAPHCHRLGPAVTLKWVIYFSNNLKLKLKYLPLLSKLAVVLDTY